MPIRYLLLLVPAAFLSLPASGQSDSLSAHQLDEFTVSAYASRRNMLESSAPVGILTAQSFDRYASSGWLNAANSVPGIRMEERSPGSYRFSIRGSLIRSPFGIRNVKFYWNGIPFTEASGNTPLNLLDFHTVERMELIKGPGSSLYGAGTGGVVLMNSVNTPGQRQVTAGTELGKYGFQGRHISVSAGGLQVKYGHQQQEGYREQSAMARDIVSFSSVTYVGKGRLSLLGTYADLYYQTPGGITLAQYRDNPKMARQPAGAVPGSIGQNARIYSRYTMAGGSYSLPLSAAWQQDIALYLTTTDFANPFITNFEKREEKGLGGRSSWQYRSVAGSRNLYWTSGFEWQYGRSVQRNYDNDSGAAGQQQTSEDLGIWNGSLFSQVEAELPAGFIATGGISYNAMKYVHEQYFPAPYARTVKTFEGNLMPRIALNKTLHRNWSVTAAVSRGFSPPTLQEVRPSAGGFRRDLEPETGLNRELTFRNSSEKFSAEVSLYAFGLNQTIVRRSDDTGAEFFVNAGKTRQNGVEWRFDYDLIRDRPSVRRMKIWHSGTYTHYTFRDYTVQGGDISGNRLPGIPGISQNTGADLLLTSGLSLYAVYQFGGRFYLNDANTVESSPYHQFLIRASWKKSWGKHLFSEVSVSAEKVKADIYSLGFDLNAFGNRYYNAAPKDNLYGGLRLGWKW